MNSHLPSKSIVFILAVGIWVNAQRARPAPATDHAADGDGPLRRLVLENNVFRVYKLELEPSEHTQPHRHGKDVVTIALEDSDLLEKAPAKDAAIKSWKSGEVAFRNGAFVHTVGNAGSSRAVLIEIELKQHWDVPVEPCREPRQCIHSINLGIGVVAETTSLFTNGFVSAYRHSVVPGGSLTSSYYSAKGRDQIVAVALSDMNATFGGINESLKKGQVFYSEATEVEANAGEHEIRWIVVRLHTPKTSATASR